MWYRGMWVMASTLQIRWNNFVILYWLIASIIHLITNLIVSLEWGKKLERFHHGKFQLMCEMIDITPSYLKVINSGISLFFSFYLFWIILPCLRTLKKYQSSSTFTISRFVHFYSNSSSFFLIFPYSLFLWVTLTCFARLVTMNKRHD